MASNIPTFANGQTLDGTALNLLGSAIATAVQDTQIGAPQGVAQLDGSARLKDAHFIQGGTYGTATYFEWNPASNDENTYSHHAIQTSTSVDLLNHFALAVDVTSKSGAPYTSAGSEGNNVAIFAGIEASAGSGNVWAHNSVTQIGTAASSLVSAQGYELDFNNLLQHYGDTDGSSGLNLPFAVGLNISGASTFRGTSAQIISGSLATYGDYMWNRGISFAPYAARLTTIADYGNAYRILDVGTATRQVGLDLSTCDFSVFNIAFKYNGLFVGIDNVATPHVMMTLDGTGNLHLGGTSTNTVLVPSIITHASMSPAADNTINLGNGSQRFATVYAADGVVTTSDASLKTDITPIDGAAALAYVRATKAYTYRWKQTSEITQQPQTIQVHAKDAAGQPVFDEIDETDASGATVMTTRTVKTRDATGKRVETTVQVPKRKTVPRMEARTVTGSAATPRAGKRIHVGFLADEIANNAQLLGIAAKDFGAWVSPRSVDPGSAAPDGYRPHEKVPTAYAAIAHVADLVTALQAEVAALKAQLAAKGAV